MKFRILIVWLCSSAISYAHFQEVSETTATSVVSPKSTDSKPVPLSATSTVSSANGPARLQVNASVTTAALNREILERKAGQEAGKLLLRSQPSGARVWIDGLFIGKTPVLLFLLPGKHRMELHGSRQKFASRVLEVSPRETSDLLVKLTVRYPTNVVVR